MLLHQNLNIFHMITNVISGGYVVVKEKLPNYVVPDLTDFKLRTHLIPLLLQLKPYVSQCPIEVKTAEAGGAAK
ncbi:hypothetical protein L484_008344 [Morus notabilis]|uniref:Uncharacterized protein n=1 Tax=Morus notabilis TaxID=981085 RepID=W9S009_9ROSA|nr:hypothetical protein L484_008344 [Morus notabilis]